ncbi:MAG: UDP-N-acetylmuramoyl-tripeptide--D-alanyl-D-alanine ligase [Bacteroidales bacterium]|nr:UDP-N-acetylmuramoyl-tripeptide--D-alanyl-D-alanine ligase [Bacteroidales bacterium]
MENSLIEQLYEAYLAHPSITTDSRKVEPGQIFFALKGERFDGNAYVDEVLAKGASLAVIDDASRSKEGTFLVPDVLTALQQLAAHHRRQFRNWQRPVKVIGITGTNGKTTTKELIRSVLSRKFNVLATEGNLNNQIGVPLTLLKVKPEHELAIIEMGANHPMDISELCAIVHPDFGLITNVGKAHLLGFGSLEGVIAAKTELYKSVAADGGMIFIDSFNRDLLNKAIAYGVQCRPYLPGTVDDCSPYLTLSIYDTEAPEPIQVHTHLIGSYNAINCLAAATVGRFFGVSIEEVGKAIESYEPQNMRSQLVDLGYGNQLIMDAYNANATSMHAALSSFKMNNAPHKSVILGDMRELGDESQKEHGNVLNYLFTSGIELDMIVLVGEEFCKAFKTWGMTYAKQHPMNVRCFDNVQDLIDDGTTLGNMGGTILVKGSRSMQLEKAAEAIKNIFINK